MTLPFKLNLEPSRDKAVLHEAWRVAAQTTRDVLESGQNAAFLTIGDPLVYSTFGYLMRTLCECAPHLKIEVVPGITSFQAAAARTRTVLCENGETLRIIPGINSRQSLEESLHESDTAVILKAYRNLPAIAEALDATKRLDSCLLASHVEQPAESVRQGLGGLEGTPPYMSLILSRKPKA